MQNFHLKEQHCIYKMHNTLYLNHFIFQFIRVFGGLANSWTHWKQIPASQNLSTAKFPRGEIFRQPYFRAAKFLQAKISMLRKLYVANLPVASLNIFQAK